MDTDLAQRLRLAREKGPHGRKTQQQIANACGITREAVAQWEARDPAKRTTPILEHQDTVARVTGVSFEWLATGRGSMERAVRFSDTLRVTEEFAVGEARSPAVSASEKRPGYIRIPRLAVEAGAGEGTLVEQEAEVVEMLEVAEWWAQQNLPRDLSKVRVVTARGDSMAPDIQHGDVLFVDVSSPRFEAPGLYVLNWNGRALVKRLVPELASRRVALVSSNPAYPAEHVNEADLDSLHIAGRVAAWWTLRKY